jgi:hypothetical protein
MKRTALALTGLALALLANAQPPRTSHSLCCSKPPLQTGFTGGNASGLEATTKPSTADIAIVHALTKVERTVDGFTFTIAVANDNGNNCTPNDNSRAIITLPADVAVVSVRVVTADGSTATWTQCGATIEASLGHLCLADQRIGRPSTITIKTQASPYTGSACLPAFGVFAFSGMPDHVPGNNQWWWREHCTDGASSSPREQPLPTIGYRP